jgi:hypothetical protein
MKHGRAIAKGGFFLVAASILLLVVSCASVHNQYRQANIRVVTNARVVAGLHFINGWQKEADNMSTAQEVGNGIANDLGKKGSHDIDILVELKSRGGLETSNIWTISIYSASASASLQEGASIQEPAVVPTPVVQ